MVRVSQTMWVVFTVLVVLFLTLPLLLVILFSFNVSALTSLPLTGFTLDWYERLFANESFWPAWLLERLPPWHWRGCAVGRRRSSYHRSWPR